jgi:hypothetical protein
MVFWDLVFYICKGYKVFSFIENIWLKRLMLCGCLSFYFPFQIVIVDELLLTMIKETMNLHVLLNLASRNIVLQVLMFRCLKMVCIHFPW